MNLRPRRAPRRTAPRRERSPFGPSLLPTAVGLLGTIVKVVGVVLLVLVGLGAYLWFTDYGAQATITDRSSACPPGEVVVTPKLLPSLDHRTALDCSAWSFVCVGHEVEFRLQTKQYKVLDESGRVVYDSRTGETDTVGLARCGATNVL